jgi:UDP-glucose 4-epimerase
MPLQIQQKKIRCLLTGARGNLGQAIQRTNAFDVVSADRNNWSKFQGKNDHGTELIIHAAGDLTTPLSQHPTIFIDSNTRALAEILEWAGKFSVPKLFFISSCAVYGDTNSSHESSPTHPFSPNGIAKLLCERLTEAYCQANKIDYTILRVFNIFGGNDRFSVLHHLRQALAASKPFTLNNQGRAHRDFVHVDDVAEIIAKLSDIPKLPAIINIGTGTTTRIADLVTSFSREHPSLQISHRQSTEAEYSRADVGRLNSYISHNFRSILDYVQAAQP